MVPNPQSPENFKRKVDLWLRKNSSTEWLLDTRKRNKCSISSSVNLFLKYGRHELNIDPLCRNGKHIEFIGLNGSGKTTLYHFANRYLKQYLRYSPGPQKTWMEILKDDRVTTGKNYSYRLLNEFIKNHKTFFSWAINRYSMFEGVSYKLKDIDFSLQYFLAICTFYQTRFRENYSVWTMLDEGFYEILLLFSLDRNNIFQPDLVKEIVLTSPRVDLLFYVKADVGECFERLKKRSMGIPGPYRGFTEKELLDYFETINELIFQFAMNIPSGSLKVVEIDNNQSLEESFSLIKQTLDDFAGGSKE